MKKLFIFCLLTFGIVCYAGCTRSGDDNVCRIIGVVPDSTKEGKKIFLVPFEGPQDAAHVDSVVIKDGKFEFVKDSIGVEIIRLDYHFRENTQELLVITEPGEVHVTIGANSTTSGTPQNDSLQVWKDLMISQNMAFNQLRKKKPNEAEIRDFQSNFSKLNRAFIERQPSGMLKDFLSKMYPTKK